MARKFEWTHERTELLIDGYKSRPCLWDTTTAEYHDRKLKQKAREELATSLTTTVVEIEIKIRNLRSQCGREKKKLPRKSESGVGRSKPWWLSEKLAFLAMHLESKKGQSTSKETAGSSTKRPLNINPVPNPKKPKREDEDRHLSQNLASLDHVETPSVASKSEEDIFGEMTSAALKALPSAQYRTLAMHRVQNVLFETKCLALGMQQAPFDSVNCMLV